MMKIIKPFYYDEFRCIGGECKDSCCIGWKAYMEALYKDLKEEGYDSLAYLTILVR